MKGIPGFRGERLRQAREAMGLNQTKLADLLNVSRQAVSQYESGADTPSPTVFDQIRAVLRHDAQFFLRPAFPGTTQTQFYRSMASMTKTARLRAETRQIWMRELLGYISELVELPPVCFPAGTTQPAAQISMEEIEGLAWDVRQQWKLSDAPIRNLVSVAETQGAIVVRHALDSASLDAMSEWLQPEDRPLILLNSDKNSAVRSRLDLGHEIGHMLLHRNVSKDQFADDEQFQLLEAQAFRFGAALLLPERPFLEDLYTVTLDALRSLKLKWKVSIAMMIERLRDLGIVTAEQYRRLRINYSTRGWNRVEPYDNEIPVEEPTLFAKCLQFMDAQNLQRVDQIATQSGFSAEWIERLLAVKTAPEPPLPLRLIEFKLRA
jgi:Zn-dependent peptidase ImmA (M78 family)/transcriptional regulator with XRE-family HTH domain